MSKAQVKKPLFNRSSRDAIYETVLACSKISSVGQRILLTCKLPLRFWISSVLFVQQLRLTPQFQSPTVTWLLGSVYRSSIWIILLFDNVTKVTQAKIPSPTFALSIVAKTATICMYYVSKRGPNTYKKNCFLYQNPHGNWWKNSPNAICNMATSV